MALKAPTHLTPDSSNKKEKTEAGGNASSSWKCRPPITTTRRLEHTENVPMAQDLQQGSRDFKESVMGSRNNPKPFQPFERIRLRFKSNELITQSSPNFIKRATKMMWVNQTKK